MGRIELTARDYVELEYAVVNFDENKTLPMAVELSTAPENLNVTLSSSLYNGNTTVENSQALAAQERKTVAEVPYANFSSVSEIEEAYKNSQPSQEEDEQEAENFMQQLYGRPYAEKLELAAKTAAVKQGYKTTQTCAVGVFFLEMYVFFYRVAAETISIEEGDFGYYAECEGQQYRFLDSSTGNGHFVPTFALPDAFDDYFSSFQGGLIVEQIPGLIENGQDPIRVLPDCLEINPHDMEDFFYTEFWGIDLVEDENNRDYYSGLTYDNSDYGGYNCVSGLLDYFQNTNNETYEWFTWHLGAPEFETLYQALGILGEGKQYNLNNPNDLFAVCKIVKAPCLLVKIRFDIADIHNSAKFEGKIEILLGRLD